MYDVHNEVPAGSGFADIVVKTRNDRSKAYILELKLFKTKKTKNDNTALAQIESKRYADLLKSEGYKDISLIGIVFKGRQVESLEIA
jgi:hypothetical protein